MPSVLHGRGRWLNYEWAVSISLIGAFLAVAGIVITSIVFGLSDRTSPIVVTVLASIGLATTNLVSALKATEAADTASKAQNIASFTASQLAALQQEAQACSNKDCPLKGATHNES